jgi:hypothetical protein
MKIAHFHHFSLVFHSENPAVMGLIGSCGSNIRCAHLFQVLTMDARFPDFGQCLRQ